MARKRWTPREDSSPALEKFREKRKWQINLRRYVINKSPCPQYAPYFGLDISNLRKWLELQFTTEMNWENFGKAWQFEHILPVAHFDFSNDEDLKLCWNFINLKVASLQSGSEQLNRSDLLLAKGYFEELFKKTGFQLCEKMLIKIDKVEITDLISTSVQQIFINEQKKYLETIQNYSAFEFELLNSGRDMDWIKKEIEFYRNL